MTKIGFIGQGWIGKNYADNFEERGFDIVRYSLEANYSGNKENIKDCEIVFIAVPTPTTPEGFNIDILKQVIKLIGKGKIALIKSTIMPGTTSYLQKENPDIFVLHSPEFLTRHTAAYDAANPTRNIIGLPEDNEIYRKKAQSVMDILPKAPYEIICHSLDAELVKYGGNCFFYFKNIFMNMLYDLSLKTGSNWENVREMIAADPRIGEEHTHPINKGGRGAGGDCLIKDFEAFIRLYKDNVGDEIGMNVLINLRDKNIGLLLKSKKDLDLLKGVYGNDIFK
jgi:UDP-glucose 6-dehydrogenase